MADDNSGRRRIVEAPSEMRMPPVLGLGGKMDPAQRIETVKQIRSLEDMLNGKDGYYGEPYVDPEANVGVSDSLKGLPAHAFGTPHGFGSEPARTHEEAEALTASIVGFFGGGELAITAHEKHLRTEMTVAQEVWRGDVPVTKLGEGQNPSDHRDQQHTAAWAEARFLVAGKETDEAAVRIAAELAVSGRDIIDNPREASELATAITAIHRMEQDRMKAGDREATEASATGRSGLTYEGIDASEHEASWLKGMDLPGERVRIDTEARISGVDVHEKMDQLGMDPLTISKSIVRTEEREDILGNKGTSTFLEYEFEGKEGRHPAKQFMEEAGREHMYAAVVVKDDRMWAVPLVEDEARRDGTMVLDGPAREIVGYAGKDLDQLHPDGFAAFRDEVREEGGASGEFYVQARDGFGSPGPLNILNAPWTSSLSMDERAIAEPAIEKALAKETREREDPVGVLVDEMSGKSRTWRLERERVDFTGRNGEGFHSAPPVTTPEKGLALAREEANYLMRGHDANSANVRMAAAMVATEGREVTGNTGDLNATSLADSLSPGVEGSRKGVLAQAAAGLSRSMSSAPSRGPAQAPSVVDLTATRNDGNGR
jgi:hypothetical protein